jgi:hypothetical protein
MTAPIRVQLSRAKGWRMPPNTVKVDRSTPWGNPFTLSDAKEAGYIGTDDELLVMCVADFQGLFRDRPMAEALGYPTDLSPLRGKNLACWCKPGSPCHADVLLELANA